MIVFHMRALLKKLQSCDFYKEKKKSFIVSESNFCGHRHHLGQNNSCHILTAFIHTDPKPIPKQLCALHLLNGPQKNRLCFVSVLQHLFQMCFLWKDVDFFWNVTVSLFVVFSADFPALVVKASGLAAGKGVIVAKDQDEACQAVMDIMKVPDIFLCDHWSWAMGRRSEKKSTCPMLEE